MFLGIEIGGTKLQLAIGKSDGHLPAQWRGNVDPQRGGEGIRQQIATAVPTLLEQAQIGRESLRGIGVGFGGPTDDATQSVIKSHHIAGWDGFPLAKWLEEMLGVPTVICNDADVAGLAEAEVGAGRGLSPLFYITVGSGIGGGLIIDGKIYRGVGKGAAEIGHLRPVYPLGEPHDQILEYFASGLGIGKHAMRWEAAGKSLTAMRALAGQGEITGAIVGQAAMQGDPLALEILDSATQALAEGICSVIKLLCPRRVIIGGGVSLMGDTLFFEPLRRYVRERGFQAFEGMTDIVPAQLGEAVVLHGALALARRRFGP